MTHLETCDTSVLVPALAAWHPEHERARALVTERVSAIPAHVLLECYSVLTRLPGVHRVRPEHAADAVAGLTHSVLALPGDLVTPLIADLARVGVRGGAVYDALVAATARHHGALLHSADRRARSVYDAVGVAVAPF